MAYTCLCSTFANKSQRKGSATFIYMRNLRCQRNGMVGVWHTEMKRLQWRGWRQVHILQYVDKREKQMHHSRTRRINYFGNSVSVVCLHVYKKHFLRNTVPLLDKYISMSIYKIQGVVENADTFWIAVIMVSYNVSAPAISQGQEILLQFFL
jgi:hypothetical protein